MSAQEFDYLIVGSGAGGATLARELSKRGQRVLVIERGKLETSFGKRRDALRYYDLPGLAKTPRRSREGTYVYRAFMAGGTTMVSAGNGVRCLEKELGEYSIHLEDEFAEVEQELNIHLIDERLLSDGSRQIRQSAGDLGYTMELMPKFIDPEKCRQDSLCSWGCAAGARWSAIEYLNEAKAAGAEVLFDTSVEKVKVERGKVKGVVGKGPRGPLEIAATKVILAAGGLSTPLILQHSGIDGAGAGLFIDIAQVTFGVTKGLNQLHEPLMALVDTEFYKDCGFILSPWVTLSLQTRLIEMGLVGITLPNDRLIGIMTKIRDESSGEVFPDGTLSKQVTRLDWEKLKAGESIARSILIKAGADPKSIISDHPSGGHPGGTAAIGKVVDSSLQTDVEGLFVCDASVLPVAPGLPPIVTILALAKRLGKYLVN